MPRALAQPQEPRREPAGWRVLLHVGALRSLLPGEGGGLEPGHHQRTAGQHDAVHHSGGVARIHHWSDRAAAHRLNASSLSAHHFRAAQGALRQAAWKNDHHSERKRTGRAVLTPHPCERGSARMGACGHLKLGTAGHPYRKESTRKPVPCVRWADHANGYDSAEGHCEYGVGSTTCPS